MKSLVALLTAALAAVFICGCSGVPRPFEPGAETLPPIGCAVLRNRKGEC